MRQPERPHLSWYRLLLFYYSIVYFQDLPYLFLCDPPKCSIPQAKLGSDAVAVFGGPSVFNLSSSKKGKTNPSQLLKGSCHI